MSSYNFPCRQFQRQQWEYYVTASWVSHLEHYVIRSFPLARSKGSSPHTNDITRQPAADDRQREKKKKKYPGCLAHVVSGMFYSVVATRRQPNLHKIGGGQMATGTAKMLRGDTCRFGPMADRPYTKKKKRQKRLFVDGGGGDPFTACLTVVL